MKNIAIFASGNGTNCSNIIRHFNGSDNIRVAVVITNNPKAKVIERTKEYGTKTVILTKTEINNSSILLPLLRKNDIDLIVLAGFMLFIPDFLTEAYPHKIINIHPSLLPKYGGKGMYGIYVHKAVRNNHEKESGITIHYVSNEYDRGEIIEQHATAIYPEDTPEEIAAKVHILEYKYLPLAIERILSEE